MSTASRRQSMFSLIRAQEFVSVQALADRFGVSVVTVRSDLDRLAADGLVRRVRGGAMIAAQEDRELSFEVRLGSYPKEKAAVGAAAADLVEPGSAVILDGGSTCMAVATALAARPELDEVTVYTPALNIALALEAAAPRITVVVTGGTVHPKQHSLGGPYSELILERVIAGIGFIGCNGVSAHDGISAATPSDARIKRRIMASAKYSVAVTDASKFLKYGTARVCDVDEVDLILTSADLDAELLASVAAAGAVVRMAEEIGGGDGVGERRAGRREPAR